jgi:hypothetical protein
VHASATRPTRQFLLFGLALGFGITIGYLGSRPHFDDTGIQAGLLVLSAGVLGALGPDRPWLWALAIGLWTPVANWLVANPPDPRSKPLPLPWGMTSSAPAQAIVGTAIMLLFPLVGGYAGMLFRRMLSATLD